MRRCENGGVKKVKALHFATMVTVTLRRVVIAADELASINRILCAIYHIIYVCGS